MDSPRGGDTLPRIGNRFAQRQLSLGVRAKTTPSSFLDAEELCSWLKRHPVNSLFRQLNGVKADAADLVALLLH